MNSFQLSAVSEIRDEDDFDDDFDVFDYYEGETIEEQDIASHEEVQVLSELCAAESLSGKRPTAKVIKRKNKFWVCVSSVSSGATGTMRTELQEVIAAEQYTGRARDNKARGAAYYTGLIFTDRKKQWAMLPHTVELFSERHTNPTQEPLWSSDASV